MQGAGVSHLKSKRTPVEPHWGDTPGDAVRPTTTAPVFWYNLHRWMKSVIWAGAFGTIWRPSRVDGVRSGDGRRRAAVARDRRGRM